MSQRERRDCRFWIPNEYKIDLLHGRLFYFSLFLAFFLFAGNQGLKNVRLRAAPAVQSGDILRLECDYDLENAQLYSIKWYFGDNEFYRYVPKESPPTRVFPLPGVVVDVSILKFYDVATRLYLFTSNVDRTLPYCQLGVLQGVPKNNSTGGGGKISKKSLI